MVRRMKELRGRRGLRVAAGFAGALLLAAPGLVRAEWTAPEEERQVPNPVPRTAESIAKGRTIFIDNCATCHGETGVGDGPGSRVLEVKLPDLTNAEWAAQRTDGEWYYKIATGKDPMMGYEDFLEEEEIWHVVNFIRDLSTAKTAEAAPADEAEAHANATMTDPADATTTDAMPVADPHAAEAHLSESNPAQPLADDAGTTVTAAVHSEPSGGAGHGEHATAPSFDPKGISNYESTHAKAPLVLTLLVSIVVGGIFVAFQKMVPPPPGSEPQAAGHGHDAGHGHH